MDGTLFQMASRGLVEYQNSVTSLLPLTNTTPKTDKSAYRHWINTLAYGKLLHKICNMNKNEQGTLYTPGLPH